MIRKPEIPVQQRATAQRAQHENGCTVAKQL